MKLRLIKFSTGTFAIQQEEQNGKWTTVQSGFLTTDAAEAYIITDLGVDINYTVVATYVDGVKFVNP